jgi:hypothetical protein
VFCGVESVPKVDGDRGESLSYDSLSLHQSAYHRSDRTLSKYLLKHNTVLLKTSHIQHSWQNTSKTSNIVYFRVQYQTTMNRFIKIKLMKLLMGSIEVFIILKFHISHKMKLFFSLGTVCICIYTYQRPNRITLNGTVSQDFWPSVFSSTVS